MKTTWRTRHSLVEKEGDSAYQIKCACGRGIIMNFKPPKDSLTIGLCSKCNLKRLGK